MIKTVLYISAVIFLISWLLGFFFLGAGALIHILAIFSVLLYLQAIILAPRTKPGTNIFKN